VAVTTAYQSGKQVHPPSLHTISTFTLSGYLLQQGDTTRKNKQ